MGEKAYRARFVRDLRRELCCDQTTFALIFGVTPAAVSRWENERALPRDRTWERLHDLQEEVRSSVSPERQIALLKFAVSLDCQCSPAELLLRGELERELEARLRELELSPREAQAEYFPR